MKRVIREVMLVILFSLVFASHGYTQQAKPPTTTSWYIEVPLNGQGQTLYDWMYWRGYDLGQWHLSMPGTQDGLVILMFGRPEIEGSTYGASGYDLTTPLPIVSLSTIEQAAEWFGWGYRFGAGSDTQSYARVIIGVSNHNSANAVTYAHGQQWALMVNRVHSWFVANVQSAGYPVYAHGGIDAEPDFSTASATRNWVNGYDSVNQRLLFNFGSADGCPLTNTSGIPGNCNNGWNQEDIYYVSWGAPPSYPLPQIYSTGGGNAKQWQQLSLYSYLAYGGRMDLQGPLSQYQSCIQRPPCSGINNTSDQAWSQLRDRLNEDGRTAQNMWYSSDIKHKIP